MGHVERIRRDQDALHVIDLFDHISRDRDLPLTEDSSGDVFMQTVADAFARAKASPHVVYGRRVEAMFGYVAASLGACSAIKMEDAGELLTTEHDAVIPDYRVLLKDGSEFFVEVKNCHKSWPMPTWSCQQRTVDGLRSYSRLFGKECKIAIYWSRWNLWTMFGLDRLECRGRRYSIGLAEAAMANEMGTLGDASIGTVPPLTMRLIADTNNTRLVDDSGQFRFVVGGFELCCGGRRIREPMERNLAFYFILFGDWRASGWQAHYTDGALAGVKITSAPEHSAPEQGFDFIGQLSGMISSYYRWITSDDSKVTRVRPSRQPGSLGVSIPEGYKGKVLKLWIFHQVPGVPVRK